MTITTGRPEIDELRDVLDALGAWQSEGAPMRTPLHRDRTEPVEDPGVGIAVARPEQAPIRARLQRIVCTPSSNAAAVATYKAAGVEPLEEVRDLRRDG
jgi:hypothetical protein